ncbi:aminotransferase class I/II-fold pyridoxal phosphate-dependent enzyme, partial [uncultured Desulfovibrio sp.]|uniref:aminotransferase class I/II-fold pyridoxal phosphate-dependent enzyme n=1 Tax=uncultured Desulfovibrio sp. TaxID=167968 RepID=UPI00263A4EAF
MKNDHSAPAEAGQQADGRAGFNRMRSKLSFERMVDLAAGMGLENPLFACHDQAAKATTLINGKEYINFSTYDYLDINAHPEITAAVAETAARFGTSAGASRLVGGERPPHRELERAFAELYDVEDAIVYVSGHATNVSTLGFMYGSRDAIFHDGLAHNSLVQG